MIEVKKITLTEEQRMYVKIEFLRISLARCLEKIRKAEDDLLDTARELDNLFIIDLFKENMKD